MQPTDDENRVVASLADRLAALTFAGRTSGEVTRLLVDTVADWGRDHGWRVYRRAASVARLPPPYEHQHSYLDVACARPGARPIVVEIDHTDRRRTVEKLLEEAAAGRVAIWVRWGSRGFRSPPSPVRMVTITVTSQRGLHTRRAALPVPDHGEPVAQSGEQPDLF